MNHTSTEENVRKKNEQKKNVQKEKKREIKLYENNVPLKQSSVLQFLFLIDNIISA